MKLESLKPGMVVFDVGRRKMGNTTLSTVCVWRVRIETVDLDKGTVLASWNTNAARSFGRSSWSKWRLEQPMLIKSAMGSHRLATRAEIAASKAAAAAAVKTQG